MHKSVCKSTFTDPQTVFGGVKSVRKSTFVDLQIDFIKLSQVLLDYQSR